ncbi:unnamed protein product [Urochloa decumbens]|uniref:SKP1-like protein n=1 Tax=Urochloa decumbens TaxID=240449 RepID=A0ABC8ZW95_9POAL
MAAAASTSTATARMVRLRSSDGELFEVAAEAIAAASGTIKGMLEDDCAADVIPLPNVTAAILSRVLEYVNEHYSEYGIDENAFDKDFVKVDNDTLYDLILAANYLNMEKLLDLGCMAVAEQMRGKTPEQMRSHFNIVNDLSPEEEEEIRAEIPWAFK